MSVENGIFSLRHSSYPVCLTPHFISYLYYFLSNFSNQLRVSTSVTLNLDLQQSAKWRWSSQHA